MDLKELAKNIGSTHYPGSSTKQGRLYHDIPFEEFKVHRSETNKRANLIKAAIDIKGKRGLDVGCNVGGISFYLQQAGAIMTGIDYDPEAIVFAKEVAKKFDCPVHFVCREITAEAFNARWDFIVWFDNWMWIEKQNGFDQACDLLALASESAPVMFFSTSQNDGQAKNQIKTKEDVYELLKRETCYTNIQNLGTVNDKWHQRSIFFCRR